MKPICMPHLPRRLGLAACTAGALLLAGCATQPVQPPVEPDTAAESLLAPLAVPVASLTPQDPGITALAAALSGANLVSFMGTGMGTQEDARLKSALTEILTERYRFGLVILNTPCAGADELDAYAAGAPTGALAADVVRSAGISEALKTAALADLLTVLRGWNALNTEAPVRISGDGCQTARDTAPDRPAIFWGLTEAPADMGEKVRAAKARGEAPAGPHIWLVQVFDETLQDIIPAAGWIDMNALPADPLVAQWRKEAGVSVLRVDHAWSADIVFRHPDYTPAEAP